MCVRSKCELTVQSHTKCFNSRDLSESGRAVPARSMLESNGKARRRCFNPNKMKCGVVKYDVMS